MARLGPLPLRSFALCLGVLLLSACDVSVRPSLRVDGGTGGGDLDGSAGGDPDGSTGGRDASSGGPGECGDARLDSGEGCDDGNTVAGDGCDADCQVEDFFVCLRPGVPCIRIVECGNGRREGPEECDDRNLTAGDGCSDTCIVEDGWICPFAGAACRAAACGDGFAVELEECDDGDTEDGDGCSSTCELEEGFTCEGGVCRATTCGDMVVEGTEDCDDGNALIGDGCTPFCTREPECEDGSCTAVCGDEAIFAPETCDDGNTRSGDGCSADCRIEAGFTCEVQEIAPPETLQLPIVLRDFLGWSGDTTDQLQEGEAGATAPFRHPDFQAYQGAETGMVEATLDADGKPVRSDTASRITSQDSFRLWYRSDDDFNRTVAQRIPLDRQADGSYQFFSESFFPLTIPLDGSAPAGFVAEGLERTASDGGPGDQVNFYFTSEIRYWFEFNGTEFLEFEGDDDVWVFFDGKLAVDIGGVHSALLRNVDVGDWNDALPEADRLRIGGIYEAVVFQAERRQTRSEYRLSLTNFNREISVCDFTCGDGIVTRFEACDDGAMNGAEYNGCTSECLLAPFCGDGIVQEEFGEVCDGGGVVSAPCAPDCQSAGARCGDGVVQTDRGEQCDDGNTEPDDGCSPECLIELG